jgi:serine/threonine protein kinase/CheY-like chemotaxis protein
MGDRQSGLAISREEFLHNLSASGLFSEESLAALHSLPGIADAADGAAVARCLTAAGKLTSYQAERVGDRRFEGLLLGNYEVLDRLGAGGMGTVFKARHRRMKRVVALKLLSPQLGQSQTFVQRFQREVEAAARLSHPHVVMAFDADEAEAGHFLVMEYINGRDLASEVRERGPLTLAEAVRATLETARALEYAHAQGVIHRDIKPANLLRDVGGAVKVADLGLARFQDALGRPGEPGAGLTEAGGMLGTADFMPPEQARDSSTIDHRADIYSLGCTLYFLATARPPYPGQTLMEVLLRHRDDPIPSLGAATPEAPPALDEVFQRMVAKKPADRYQSMSAVVRELEALRPTLPSEVSAPTAAPQLLSGPGGPPTILSPAASTAGPMDATAGTIALAPAASPVAATTGVLLVEPSRTQASIIRKYLQAASVQHVVTVPSGQEALKALRADPPDAVVSALHLADMTGVQLARQIRSAAPAAAPGFVLISSESESSEAGLLSQSGQAVVLHKPFTAEKLMDALSLASRRFASLKPPPGAQPAHPAGRDKLRVLIVDDSTTARAQIRTVLAGLGLAQFVEVPDGAQAVAAVVRETFQLIVTDYNMPHMDGQGLVGFLKQNPSTKSVPIIMITTETDPAKLEAVRRLGVAAICDKSFPVDVVRSIIDRLPC